MANLSVIIPALNEEKAIDGILRRTFAAEQSLARTGFETLEVIVVDDGSKDRTAQIVHDYPRVRLLTHTTNRGYGAALKSGFNSATSDWLAFFDADGTYPPESLAELCGVALAEDADIVVGSRMSGASSRMPLIRRVGNGFFAGLLSILGNAHVADAASGMRVFRKDILQLLYPLPNGLNFTPAMSTRALHEQLRVIEVPIPYDERVGRSKLNPVTDGTRFLQAIVWAALSYNPVGILGLVGLAFMVGAILIGAGMLALRLQGVTTLGPWGVFSVFSALILLIAGASIFALGTTFNYLVSLFHRRPIRQGLFGRPIFNPPLDDNFGWIGLAVISAGIALAVGSLAFGLSGWAVERIWLYLVGSAASILVGLQLCISWIISRVLRELSKREL